MNIETEVKVRSIIVTVLMSAYSETITPQLVKDLTDKIMDVLPHAIKSEETKIEPTNS